jgi:long-chain fatty acid transport protein
VVKVQGSVPFNYSQNMTGSAIDYGYNLALNSHPIPELSLAMTYRSKVDLSVEGNADLTSPLVNGNVPASVSVPVPAVLSLAGAYSFTTGTTLEFTYERTYWSAYKNLDFDYSIALPGGLGAAFDNPKPKNYEDTNTYRLGLTQKYDKWIAMAGIAYDETPVPESTLGYELPDSDAWIISLGGKYKMDEQWTLGLAGLVDIKKSRDVNNDAIDGEFSNAKAYLVTAGIEYKF